VVVFILCLAAAFGAPAAAHEVSRSQSTLRVSASDVLATVTLDLVEFSGVDLNRDDVVSHEELEPQLDRIYSQLKAHFALASAGALLRTRVLRYEIAENHLLVFHMHYAFDRRVESLTVTSSLHEVMRPDHRHFVRVEFGDAVQHSVLAAASPAARFAPAEAASGLDVVQRFVVLGIEHIITGYDHLAFLLCLVLATAKVGQLVKVVTSFAIAHSITLALAIFDLVVLPSRLVESVIAVSIAYVALENLLGIRTMDRAIVTFLFGLVHGFGFATVLREMDLAAGALGLSLFAFNVGVELGQIAFVAVALPLLWVVNRARVPAFRPAVSVGIGAVAIYWFVERALLG
jgi:hypothetical protein